MKIGVGVHNLSARCGINTYARRLCHALNAKDGAEAYLFGSVPQRGTDVLNVQYEPGLYGGNLNILGQFIQEHPDAIVLTAHHTNGIHNFYPAVDGVILHHNSQIQEGQGKPWNATVIPHPALYYPKKDRGELRDKYGLPLDKKIVGTAGFITGTGKSLPDIVNLLLSQLNDDEFLYLITSFWKSPEMSTMRLNQINRVVRKMGKQDNFRIDTDFVKEETLNEKMQCCDLLFAWNAASSNTYGSQSGIAMDMAASYVKTIVKDVPHYATAYEIDGVVKGRDHPMAFVEDVLKVLRSSELHENIPDLKDYSWDVLADRYIDFYEECSL